MTDYYFEDFFVGQKFDVGGYTLSEEEILDFGRRYVPMPYHVDREAAKESAFGGLVAPGHLTAAIVFGLFAKAGMTRLSAMGSPGMDVRWLRPVRAGDTLDVTVEVTGISPARHEGGRDAIDLSLTALNQNGEAVLRYKTLQFVERRPE